jgi:large subunit ribosomal protein L15
VKVHDIPADPGKSHKHKRVGRGEGSGHGKTACRGSKGQLARSGGGKGPSFEGGQMPLVRRVPKRGFRNVFRQPYQILNVETLNRFANNTTIDPATLWEHGLIHSADTPVKILGDGELKKTLHVKAHAFSKSARDKIAAKGGTCEAL